MSRIAIDARIINTSTGRYVERLLHYLQKVDSHNQYIVLVLKKDQSFWRPSASNFKVMVADFPIYSAREQLQFAFYLYRLRVDLVHFTMPTHPILYLKKHVMTVHDLTLVTYVNRRQGRRLQNVYTNYLKPLVFKFLLGLSIRLASHIITPTNHVSFAIQERYHKKNSGISVTPEAADKLATSSKPPTPEIKGQFILYVGNAYPYKNLERLAAAAAETNKLRPVTLILAGKPDYFYAALKTYVTKNHIGNVRFMGFVSDAELAWLYEHATLYVFPSLSEGFGLPPLEAMNYGLPVVAAKASSLPEVLGDAAVFFNPRDTNDIARVITNMLKSPQKLAEFRKAGLAHVKLFSWERMAKQTHVVYKKALNK